MNTVAKQLQSIRHDVLVRATCCDGLSPVLVRTLNLMHVLCSTCGRYFTTFIASAIPAEASPEPPLTVHGRTQSIEAWALETGITTKMIRRRLTDGHTAEFAVFSPSRTH